MSTVKRKKLNSGVAQPVSATSTISTTPLDPNIRQKANQLYDACLETKDIIEEHSIAEMLQYGVTSNEKELAVLCQENLNADLFMPYKKPNRFETVYRLRPKAEALK